MLIARIDGQNKYQCGFCAQTSPITFRSWMGRHEAAHLGLDKLRRAHVKKYELVYLESELQLAQYREYAEFLLAWEPRVVSYSWFGPGWYQEYVVSSVLSISGLRPASDLLKMHQEAAENLLKDAEDIRKFIEENK